MRIFLTGASGFIGSAVAEHLRAAGHTVLGLARSSTTAEKLAAAGVEAVRGDLRQRDVVSAAAAACDGAIHAAMEFSAEAAALDRAAVEAILAGLGASGKLFIYTSGIWVLGPTGDTPADESTPLRPTPLVAWRPAHEWMVLDAPGVRGVVLRPGRVFGRGRGVQADFRRQALTNGVVRMVGDGENRWPFVHVDDLADLYVLALAAPAGSVYHAGAGPSVRVKELAAKAAAGAPVEATPIEQARAAMGLMADAAALDQLISSEKAARELGWKPVRASVLESLEEA